jgi:predicted dehydrogenase
MAEHKIRLGIIGANVHLGWAPRSHLVVVSSSPDFELAAVCTTRKETAEESARKFGARLAFHDYREMVARPDIDAVTVAVRVPSHYEPTMAALAAGKHVYTEWPLGQTTAQAVELADKARAMGVQTMVGLQSRASAGIMYMKELVEEGYVGEPVSCHMCLFRAGVLERPSHRTWQRDVSLGANTLTIAAGHSIDAMRFVLGEFDRVSAVISTQVKEWMDIRTREMLPVTSPDNVLINARMASGVVASIHVASIPYAGGGFRMELYGTEGTVVAVCDDSPQLQEVRLEGTRKGKRLEPLDVPARFIEVPEGTPLGEPFNVAQMYQRFARAIRSGRGSEPNFATAVELHRLIDKIRESADRGSALT